jgi:hypothetical protein
MKDILEYSEKQAKLNSEKKTKEIDDYANKIDKEMNEAIDEIMFSYTEDMKDIDGKPDLMSENVFPEIMDELKNDMQNEIVAVKEKYEDLKNKEIEKIKVKFQSSE